MPTQEIEIDVVGLNKIKAKLDRLDSPILLKPLMTEIGLFAQTKIKVRTSKGVDADDKPFKPYSEKYKLFRKKHGRSTNKVNLFFHGAMMSAMSFDAGDDQVRLYFLPTTDKKDVKNSDKAFWNQTKSGHERKFFALSSSDLEEITELTKDFYKKVLES